MKFKKLVYISESQQSDLEEIKNRIEENGGSVSIMRLIQDSITVFVKKYKDQAITKFSPVYKYEV